MKSFVFIALLILVSNPLCSQSRKELEEQRTKTLEEISYVDDLIEQTNKEKSSGLNDLKIIGSKLVLRENIISGMRDEINLVNERIDLNVLAINMMEKDLIVLKKDYARTIVDSYKSSKGMPEISYLLSAKDFNQGYKRLRYLQQVTKFRRKEAETISELKEQIQATKEKLQEDLNNISELKLKEERQKNMLQEEQNNKKKLITSLGRKEKQLQKELTDKKKIAQKIEAEIVRIIEEEKRKSIRTELTPEMKLIGENFADNMGRLPWPVEKGIITGGFGIQKHPELAFIEENNPGIEITSSGKTEVRTVFKGQIASVFALKGANMAIIIRHGNYFSVYQNLINVSVKQGDMVETKQSIGEVFCDIQNGSKSIMKFMIFEEKKKLDPELWIAKK
jgi:septal ring factor EnvC (AmiA/AmiB activator)